MDEQKRPEILEDLKEAVDQYSHARGAGHDFLTDPAAVAQAVASEESRHAEDHAGRLRAGRLERGFTLEELSQKTGIEAALLNQVEKGEALLPLGHLIKVTKILSLSMADAISTGTEVFSVVRADQRTKVKRFGEARLTKLGYEYESLAPNKKDRRMEPFIVTLLPSAADELSTHDGQEFIYVLEGSMEVTVEDAREILGPGDAVYYDAVNRHLVRAHGDKPAKILAVIVS
jgi:quercetin dioxygenase-like cupin family protein